MTTAVGAYVFDSAEYDALTDILTFDVGEGGGFARQSPEGHWWFHDADDPGRVTSLEVMGAGEAAADQRELWTTTPGGDRVAVPLEAVLGHGAQRA
jgi:hypothetical protein